MTEKLDEGFHAALVVRACEALRHWPVPQQRPVLLKYRENAVFRIELFDGRFAALRLHRPGYHGEAALRSELDWMAALHDDGLNVPRALQQRQGGLLAKLPPNETFPTQYADIVSWMDGEQLGETGRALDWRKPERYAVFQKIGVAMAAMHESADRFHPPASFFRPAWDADGLLGESPLWGRFWDCDFLSSSEKDILFTLRGHLKHTLNEAEATLDYGLIHADLIRENVLVDDRDIAFIDFDDCGYGFRLFDIATTLLKNRSEPDYDDLKAALIQGYRSRRSVSDAALALLPLFLTLRSLTYIGWLAERPEVPDRQARKAHYLTDSLEMAQTGGYLHGI